LARAARPGDEVSSYVAWRRRVDPARAPAVRGPRRLGLPRRALALAWARGVGPAPRRVDVVHAPTALLPPARPPWFPRRAALVATIHDAVAWTHPETLTAPGARWHQAMGERAAREAAAVVVPTRAVAEQLRAVLAGLDPERLHVVAQGPPPSLARVSPAGRIGAARLGLPPRYLLSVATLEPRKGLDVLLRALAEPAAPDIALLVVGQPGWGGVDVAEEAGRLGIGDRVRVLGRLDDDALSAVLAGATASVLPSRAEGFGLPLVEAMSVGVPAVTSDDPALVEVGGGAAICVPRGDAAALAGALARVAGDERLRARMSAAGRLRAADFDWDASAARLWALYRGLVPSAALT
ncbi:MAG: glycosyltransferase family 4 protein, partial [Frankiaceae bacterium]|nr:glycosyltransferase family 4 protein [Frankiaceae bacterium]